jgi:hypothetical protein
MLTSSESSGEFVGVIREGVEIGANIPLRRSLNHPSGGGGLMMSAGGSTLCGSGHRGVWAQPDNPSRERTSP